MEKGGKEYDVAGWKFVSVVLVMLTVPVVSFVSVRLAEVN
jgi:hypothetical protein